MMGNNSNAGKSCLELLILITIGWLINILIEPDPQGVNVIRFGLKWFVYTYSMVAITLVFAPFLVILVLGSVVSRLVWRKANYRLVYRFAFIGAAIWTMFGNYGLWYGKSQHAQSTSSTLPAIAGQPSSESSFVMLRLPFEVAIDIPRDWWVLNEAMNQLIRTSRDAALDLRGITTSDDDEMVLLAANSWPPETYAALRVTRVQPPLAVPEEVLGLTNSELSELKREFETEMRQLLPEQGLTFLESTGIEIEEIGGWPAIVFSYRRSGPKGPVFVELIQVVRRQDFLRINLSYREGERALWMPLITRIRNSIRA